MVTIQKELKYPELFQKDAKVIESNENIANMSNKFFTSVFKQINPPAVPSVFDYLKKSK